MKNVRFLETCYLFSTGKFYNLHDEEELSDKESDRLFKSEIVDILKTEKPENPKKKTETKKTPKKKDDK